MIDKLAPALNAVNTDVIDTKEKAAFVYRALTRRYGIDWAARAPDVARDRLRTCEALLTKKERREALAML
ncbi:MULTISPECIES: hypothetical protein [Methylobacterium]|uniref:Uncharacterized protein n=1 Tax=Methylobacterium thuringiense TaxID=1003091 RepID=A0ABQ4THT5_9HYPH|nr:MULTISPECIES: hypothetical protein [Methylobacterium]TXN21765.1 hypothetical protein FV217_13220 [Methylobacterium sp. WL9]GJE54826.1 hypothetical protein EKPJFOCH_1311 [Methylobacterium thuringiense]